MVEAQPEKSLTNQERQKRQLAILRQQFEDPNALVSISPYSLCKLLHIGDATLRRDIQTVFEFRRNPAKKNYYLLSGSEFSQLTEVVRELKHPQ
ncbi:hypothetical protein HYS94_05125 [Candidatus Daviesbacteria bacterium]|nr:hypothetical protein [Candidatus Daviesbacteria bacterium]